MAVSGCVRPCFLIFNFMFWCIGLGLIGFMSWTIITNPGLSGNFVSGTRYFTYSVLGAGVLIGVTGLIGCTGGFSEGNCLIKTFISLTIAVIMVEMAGGIAGTMMSDKLSDYRDSGWQDFNTDTKDFLQTTLQCCGFSNYTEYGTNLTDIPESCFSNSTKSLDTLYEEVCWMKIRDWLDGNMPAWIGAIAGVAVLEIVCIVLALVMVNRITEASKVSHQDAQRLDRLAHRGGGGGGGRGGYGVGGRGGGGRGGYGGGGGGGGRREASRGHQDRKEIREFELQKKYYQDAGGRYRNFPNQ